MTSVNTLNRVERACAELRHNGQSVTFTAIAAHTGIGRTTLCRNPTLRAVIEDLRHRAATGGTLEGLTDEINTLRTALDSRHASAPLLRTIPAITVPAKLRR